MKYVNVIRRIIAIDKGLLRIDFFDEKYDDIWFKLLDKRSALVKSIKDFTECPDRTNKELRYKSFLYRKQVRLACRLLGVDYYKVIR